MSFTYSGDPLSSLRDEVRFLIGDTNENDAQFSDREIEYLLADESNVYLAAANGAFSLAAKYARMVDKSVGDLSISYSQRQKHFADLAAQLQRLSVTAQDGTVARPYAGGISQADKDTVESDTDRVAGFRKGMHDFLGDVDLETLD